MKDVNNIRIIKRKADSLKKEKDDGHIEYKWKLINIEKKRFMKIITQMNYRLNEGNGKSMYAIGFLDDGRSIGITYNEMETTLHHIKNAAKHINADITKILIFIENNNYWAKIFLSKNNINKNTF